MTFLNVQTPSNKIFSLDIATNESELIKLLSCLSHINEHRIKGLCDMQGHYYTFTAAIKNPQGNFNYSKVYSIIFDEKTPCDYSNDFCNEEDNELYGLNDNNYKNFRNENKGNNNERNWENNNNNFYDMRYMDLENISISPMRSFNNSNKNNYPISDYYFDENDNKKAYNKIKLNLNSNHGGKYYNDNKGNNYHNQNFSPKAYNNNNDNYFPNNANSNSKVNNNNFSNRSHSYRFNNENLKNYNCNRNNNNNNNNNLYNNPNFSPQENFNRNYNHNNNHNNNKNNLNHISLNKIKPFNQNKDFYELNNQKKFKFQPEDENRFNNFNRNNNNNTPFIKHIDELNIPNNDNRNNNYFNSTGVKKGKVTKINSFRNDNQINEIKNNNNNSHNYFNENLNNSNNNFIPSYSYQNSLDGNKILNYQKQIQNQNQEIYTDQEIEIDIDQHKNNQIKKEKKISENINISYNNNNNTFSQKSNNENNNKNKIINNNKNKTNENNNNTFNEYYLKIAKDLVELNLLEDRFFPRLKQMLLNENEDVSILFRLFCQDVIEIETLVSGINKIISKIIGQIQRPDSPPEIFNKNQLIKLIESLNEGIFDDPSDLILLKNLANFNNEFILSAYELYLSDNDIENFIDSLKRFIKKQNNPNNFYGKNLNLNFQNEINNNTSKNIRDLNKMKNLKNFGHKKNSEFFEVEEKFNFKNVNNLNPTRKSNSNNYLNEFTYENNPTKLPEEDNNINMQKLNDNNDNDVHNNNDNDNENNKYILNNINLDEKDDLINNNKNSNNNTKKEKGKSKNSKISVTNFTKETHNYYNNQGTESPRKSFLNITSNYSPKRESNNNNINLNGHNSNNNNLVQKKEKDISEFEENKGEISPERQSSLTRETLNQLENILKFLHTEQRIIFKYALKNKLPEVNIFTQLRTTIDSEDILLRTVKVFCKQFINEKITKNFEEKTLNFFKILMQKRDQNLLGLFKEFYRHNSLEKLRSEILNYLSEKLYYTNIDDYIANNSISSKKLVVDEENEKKNKKEIFERKNRDRKKFGTHLTTKSRRKKIEKIEKFEIKKSFCSIDSINENNENDNDNEVSRILKKEDFIGNFTNAQKNPEFNKVELNENDNDSNNEKNFPKSPKEQNKSKEIVGSKGIKNFSLFINPCENENNKDANKNNVNNNIDIFKDEKKNEFLKLISSFNFIGKSDKENFEVLLDEKNPEALEIFEMFLNKKNVIAIKSNLKSFVKKYILNNSKKYSKNNSIYSDHNNNNSVRKNENDYVDNYKNESTYIKPGPILSKLKTIDEFKKDKGDTYNYNYNKETSDKNLNKINSTSKKLKEKETPIKTKKENNEFSNDSETSIENNKNKKIKNKTNQINENKSYSSLNELLKDLDNSGKISSHQHKYILQRYNNKDDILQSAWEVYNYNKYLPDLIESLKIFSTNVRRVSNVITNGRTPAALTESKNDIIEFLKGKDNNREKEEIKIKQINIIKILVKENMIDKKTAPIINEMIYNENHFLISAFEIFSVSKDHWEFCETLGMITDIHCNDLCITDSENNIVHNNPTVENLKNEKEVKLENLFENFYKECGTTFSNEEFNTFRKMLKTKDEFFMSALEFYDSNLDKEEFIETLQQIFK